MGVTWQGQARSGINTQFVPIRPQTLRHLRFQYLVQHRFNQLYQPIPPIQQSWQ